MKRLKYEEAQSLNDKMDKLRKHLDVGLWFCEAQGDKIICETDEERVELSDKRIMVETLDGKNRLVREI